MSEGDKRSLLAVVLGGEEIFAPAGSYRVDLRPPSAAGRLFPPSPAENSLGLKRTQVADHGADPADRVGYRAPSNPFSTLSAFPGGLVPNGAHGLPSGFPTKIPLDGVASPSSVEPKISRVGTSKCLACEGRHRGHTCGRGGKRGRPKAERIGKPYSSEDQDTLMMGPPSRKKKNPADSAPVQVRCVGAAEFVEYLEVSVWGAAHDAAVTKDRAAGAQQLEGLLRCCEEHLRLAAGVSENFMPFDGTQGGSSAPKATAKQKVRSFLFFAEVTPCLRPPPDTDP